MIFISSADCGEVWTEELPHNSLALRYAALCENHIQERSAETAGG
jgi:hypothetical protein